MANTTAVAVDPVDVKTVLELEAPLRQLLEQIDAAIPAMERLEAADYPGCNHRRSVKEQLEAFWDLSVGPDNTPTSWALHNLEMMRIGNGDQAAIDYQHLVVEERLSLDDAVAQLADAECNATRIEAFLQYAKGQPRL